VYGERGQLLFEIPGVRGAVFAADVAAKRVAWAESGAVVTSDVRGTTRRVKMPEFVCGGPLGALTLDASRERASGPAGSGDVHCTVTFDFRAGAFSTSDVVSPGTDYEQRRQDHALCKRAHAKCEAPDSDTGFLRRRNGEVLLPMDHGAVIADEKTLTIHTRITEAQECDFARADFDAERWTCATPHGPRIVSRSNGALVWSAGDLPSSRRCRAGARLYPNALCAEP
jgi:hypothetical protein